MKKSITVSKISKLKTDMDKRKSDFDKKMQDLKVQLTQQTKLIGEAQLELETLNANDIRVKLRGHCKALEIGGETVNVSYPWFRKILIDTFDILKLL